MACNKYKAPDGSPMLNISPKENRTQCWDI